MRAIEITERLHPFSHTAGTCCLIPGSACIVEAFPARLHLKDCRRSAASTIILLQNVNGPVKDFTVSQDLERGGVRIWGHAKNGFFRYFLFSSSSQEMTLVLEKSPPEGMGIKVEAEGAYRIHFASEGETKIQVPKERLSLGSHKAQDWDLVSRRLDLHEILPHWHRLGLMTPEPVSEHELGPSLFQHCSKAIQEGPSEEIAQQLTSLFLAGFTGILVPQLQDLHYHGFAYPPIQATDPLSLLTGGAKLIRSLFMEEKSEDAIAILPHLPPEFFCGRFLNVSCAFGTVDLEWSKKSVRCIALRPQRSGELQLHFHNSIKEFRLRRSDRDHGAWLKTGESIAIEEGKILFLDRFQR